MKTMLVVGIGNRVMKDDSIGVRIVEALSEQCCLESIRFLVGETDVDYCLDQIMPMDECIIIDGGVTGEEPCTVAAYSLDKIFEQNRDVRSFHDMDLISAMKRNGLKKKGLLITVEVAEIGFSTELSPPLRENFATITETVGGLIEKYCLEYSRGSIK